MTKHDFFEQRKMYYVYDKINKNSVYPHNLLIQIIRDLVSFHLVKLKLKVFLPDCFQNGNYLHYLVILVYVCKRVSSEMQNKFLMHQQMINVSLKLFCSRSKLTNFITFHNVLVKKSSQVVVLHVGFQNAIFFLLNVNLGTLRSLNCVISSSLRMPLKQHVAYSTESLN